MSEKFSPRYAPLVATLGAELFEKVHSSKILLIGAGGIGCELIKNLVLSGFIDIEVNEWALIASKSTRLFACCLAELARWCSCYYVHLFTNFKECPTSLHLLFKIHAGH